VSTETRDSAPDAAGQPAVPPPPWQRLPERSSRRRREPISRDAIVDAAIALLDRDGLDALSMRSLAEQLGTGAASLYWHVGSKDGLLDLVLDRLIGEVAIPDADPERWQEQVREVARNQRAVSLRHPYVVRISIGRIPMGPNAIRLSERTLAIMRAGGLPPQLAVQGHLLLISTINGFTLDETGVGDPPGARPDDAPSPEEAAEMASGYLRSLPPAHFPNLVELADEYTLVDDDARFDLLIGIFVDGLARAAASAGPGSAD
jgi:AcrR family transcriptional regulator